MEYYSKSPSELKGHLGETKKKSHRKGRAVRVIFMLNLILVLVVLAIYQQLTKPIKIAKKEFRWANYNLASTCNTGGCELRIGDNPDGVDTGLVPKKIRFTVRKAGQGDNIANESVPLTLDEKKDYRFSTSTALTLDYEVFVAILTTDDGEIASFRIFP